MPGVVFLIVVPTANFERELIYGSVNNVMQAPPVPAHQGGGAAVAGAGIGGNNLNINLPENNNAILRLEVELRDKNAPKYRRGGMAMGAGRGGGGMARGAKRSGGTTAAAAGTMDNRSNLVVPLEKVLEELLVKLEIEHVTWTTSKKGYFHHVVFPLQSGEPCETTLHCLTELGIGTKLNSSVSVLPCSVSYDALTDAAANNKDDYSESSEDFSKWNNFVESIKSKLTVKQVVDGVRAGGSLSFDYLLLIVTADSLAALGLVENNAPNIVAAMLVSPLMGPVMSITFGTIIADRELMRVGFICLALGMFISCLFGFVFGLILGTTEMPWGSNDWPTEEMRGRGNVRSLWMGVLWALTSGTGVAVALLQGSAGPLIGVAISASLLPPVVNCGLFWALACIWQIYPEKRMRHLKGEALNSTSAYPFIYTDYLPTEFLINGIVSALLTVVNVICIFITAIIVLKIKEVSAPYTASPDLKRFWETDLRTARKTNRSTMRHGRGGGAVGPTTADKLLTGYHGLEEPRNRELDAVLERALQEAEDDATFKKVKRMSYSSNAAGELTQRLAKIAGLNRRTPEMGHGSSTNLGNLTGGSRAGSRMNSMRNSKLNIDLKALDKLVTTLLEQHNNNNNKNSSSSSSNHNATANSATNLCETTSAVRKNSTKLNRWHPTSRSAHSFKYAGIGTGRRNSNGPDDFIGGGGASNVAHTVNFTQQLQEHISPGGGSSSLQHTPMMPTIMESGTGSGRGTGTHNNQPAAGAATAATAAHNNNAGTWSASLERTPGAVRNVLHRLSQSIGAGNATDASNEEHLNLTQNYIA